MLSKGTVLNNQWKVESYLGEGACAKVYLVSSVKGNVGYDVVAKVIPTGNGTKSKKDKEQEKLCNTLYYEYVLYTGLLSEFSYRPQVPTKFCGVDEEKKLRYLVMEKLDTDLKDLGKKNDITSTLASKIGLQLLQGLQWLHQKGFVFIDVKPDNFMLKNNNSYFVDFGLVERVGVTPPGTVREMVGTPTYCSLNVNQGGEPGPKDDLEALGYVLLSLFNQGELPWEHSKSDTELLAMKRNCDIRELATSLGCDELGDFISLARSTCDYGRSQQLLEQLAHRSGRVKAAVKTSRRSAEKALGGIAFPSASMELRQTKRLKKGNQVTSSSNTNYSDDEIETVEITDKVLKKSTARALSPPSKQHTIDLTKQSPPPSTPGAVAATTIPGRTVKKSNANPSKTTGDRKENIPNLFSFSSSTAAPASTTVGKGKSSQSLPSQHEAHYSLRVIEGPHRDASFNLDELREKVLHIGRDEDNHIVFAGDFTVSSKHLTLKKTEDGIFIKDNGSTNKTKLNHEKIHSRRWISIHPQDRITLGETEFEIVVE